MPTRVLFFWEVSNELQKYLQNHEKLQDVNIELIFPDFSNFNAQDINNKITPKSRDGLDELKMAEYIKLAKHVEILVGWRPSRELLEASKADLFINPGAGVNRLLELFKSINTQRDTPLILVNGHGNSYFTAQHAVALLLSLMTKIIPHHTWMQSGLWRRGDSFAKSIPLRNKTVGLLGYGAVNQKVHQFLSGFDIEVTIVKRTSIPSKTEILPISKANLEEFFSTSDIVIMALPITEETDNMITMKHLQLLGQKGLLINVARGKIINEKDLYIALRNKIISGAAIDVWYDYSPDPVAGRKFPYHFPFHQLKNVILSPHRAASPFDNLRRWDEVAENIKRYALGRRDFLNIVDLDRGY